MVKVQARNASGFTIFQNYTLRPNNPPSFDGTLSDVTMAIN
jgi:hypothetical protein